MKTHSDQFCVLHSLLSLCALCGEFCRPLPNTKPLTEDGDLAAKMVAGIHKYLDRELAAPRRSGTSCGRRTPKEPLEAPRSGSGCGRCSAWWTSG